MKWIVLEEQFYKASLLQLFQPLQSLLHFYLDGVPVGEVAVDADDAYVLGARCRPDGKHQRGGEKESNQQAL